MLMVNRLTVSGDARRVASQIAKSDIFPSDIVDVIVLHALLRNRKRQERLKFWDKICDGTIQIYISKRNQHCPDGKDFGDASDSIYGISVDCIHTEGNRRRVVILPQRAIIMHGEHGYRVRLIVGIEGRIEFFLQCCKCFG
jgi:hypothetical protein